MATDVPMHSQSATRSAVAAVMAVTAVAVSGAMIASGLEGTQTPPGTLQKFEVASIKLGDPNARAQFQYLPGGLIMIHGATVSQLIQQAYDVRAYQISGGPAWTEGLRYDITARSGDGAGAGAVTADRVRPMLQTLLSDRFELQVRRESKEVPVYALVVTKSGPKLTKNDSPNPSDSVVQRGVGQLKAKRTDMRLLALSLSRLVDRPVGDQTGLTGNYDFELNWAADSLPAANPSGPSIFTAIQEQLGLKLEAGKGPVEMLVIDRVERPSGN